MLLALALGVSYCAIDWREEFAGIFPGGIVLRDRAGDVLRVSLGHGDVDCRPYYRAAPDDWIVKAIVASEDGEFWHHHGVRPLSVLRALCQNLYYRRRISGASTISMQTVRLIEPHRRSYSQKWIEAFKALKMERRKDKLWILSQYLNRAPFGSNFVGIEAAANGWFGKSAKVLGLGEAAMLAGMVQAPSRFRPDRGYARAIKRRDYVLGRMLELGMISEEQLRGAQSVMPQICRAPRPFKYPYYCDYYLKEVLGKDGKGQSQSGDYITPLDADVQFVCDETLNAAASAAGYSLAVAVMKVDNGEVIALSCSGDYFAADAGQVNTALAPRPAGSTLKPLLAAQALDLGLVGEEETLKDEPCVFDGYAPTNFDGKYRGEVSLRNSLILSLNIPFVEIVRRVGVDCFAEKLRRLDFRHVVPPYERYGLGIAIGNCEVTLVELAGAYRQLALSASGYAGGDGFSPRSAFAVSEMLSGEERAASAFGHIAAVPSVRFAWKTGTSSAYRDAWCVLWNPQYVVAVWCGHKTGFGDTAVVGVKAAAPVAWKIARSLYPRNDAPWFAKPNDTVAKYRLPTARAVHPNLSISYPQEGDCFAVDASTKQARIVCRVLGNAPDVKLWWFVDGVAVGETVGLNPMVLEFPPGKHYLVCTTAAGKTAEVSFSVFE